MLISQQRAPLQPKDDGHDGRLRRQSDEINSKLLHELHELRKELRIAKACKEQLAQEYTRYSKTMDEEFFRWRHVTGKVAAEKDKLRAENAVLKDKVKEQKQAIDASAAANARLNEKIKELEGKVARRDGDLARIRSERAELQDKSRDSGVKAQEFEVKWLAADREKEELKEELSYVKKTRGELLTEAQNLLRVLSGFSTMPDKVSEAVRRMAGYRGK